MKRILTILTNISCMIHIFFVSIIIFNFIMFETTTAKNFKQNHISLSEINYTVSFEKPFTHYCEVEINLKNISADSLIFSMPVWTPGSYMVREFSKNVEGVAAENSGKENLPVEKISKNSWRVVSKNQHEIIFRYKVYCNELTVRTSEINDKHAFLSPAGVFMYVKGFEDKKCIINFKLPSQWTKVSTGLNKISSSVYSAGNYDILVDSPVELGNQNILEFDINGIRHFICISGTGNYNPDTLISDFKKIVEEELKLFGGEIPYKDFTFIINLTTSGGGGLEHHNSFAAETGRWVFNDKNYYDRFLGLISHEFFHLWNVKRIRPIALGPFDYEKENYTKNLWVAEGWTSYYDNLILRRSGLIDDNEYFKFIEREINPVMNFSGRFHQSLEESSFDAWIKYYRQNENFENAQISYYNKGSVVAMMLNIEIIKNTNGEKSLDDVLRILYDDYKKDMTKGYTDERVKEVCEIVNGKNLDEFWNKYIRGTAELPLADYLNYAGLELINENETAGSALDIETKTVNGNIFIAKVFAGGTAYESGLNSNDEIISINNVRMNPELVKTFLKNFREGETVNVLINRNGLTQEVNVKILKRLPNYKIKQAENRSEEQAEIFNKIITGNK